MGLTPSTDKENSTINSIKLDNVQHFIGCQMQIKMVRISNYKSNKQVTLFHDSPLEVKHEIH